MKDQIKENKIDQIKEDKIDQIKEGEVDEEIINKFINEFTKRLNKYENSQDKTNTEKDKLLELFTSLMKNEFMIGVATSHRKNLTKECIIKMPEENGILEKINTEISKLKKGMGMKEEDEINSRQFWMAIFSLC